MWWLTPVDTLLSGVYKLGAKNDRNYVLNVAGNSHNNGANVWVWESANNNGDQWAVEFGPDGDYMRRETGSNKYLDVTGGVSLHNNAIPTGRNVSRDRLLIAQTHMIAPPVSESNII